MMVALAGCGSGTATVAKNPVTPAVFSGPHGEATGGQQPVVAMTLQLFAAGTTGYGSGATNVFTSEGLTLPTTSATGSFSFPPTWHCINGTDQVYLVGTGGQPLANTMGAETNANLGLMVALGTCSNLNAGTHIHMNELTTVAGVWALAPFMSGNPTSYTNVGTSATNTVGLGLAFNAAAQVVNTSTGTMPGTLPAGAVLPTYAINSLADILEACINSGGGTANDSTACGILFGQAPSGTGTVYPTDTITAAMNIAQNPARNVSNLYDIITPGPAFQPALPPPGPNAWTLAIQYTGGGLDAPTTIAVDQAGGVWVGNSVGDAVSKFDNLGNSLLGTTGTVLGGTPGGIAIDLTGNAWVTASNETLYELNSAGTQTQAYTGNGLNLPTSIAIDPSSNVWVVNSGSGANSVSAFTSGGGTVSGSPFTGAGIASPAGIAINGNANASCADCP
jgi:hypothetical protein